MDCNKEEAVRAKAIAEKKMEDKDFVGARKFATRAQQLYGETKDIPQMILVCDVHCAALKKIYGGDNDWYSILQVEPSVDEITIKKQYRKLALLLHPDKNKFAGSSDAFKLIGEAQMVLLDSQKRILYDNKYRASGRFQASNTTQRNNNKQHPSARAHPWFQNVNLGNAAPAPKPMNQQAQAQQQPKVQTQPTPNQNRATFWTVCPFCRVKYEYYKELVNSSMTCKTCNKRFMAVETSGPANYSGTSSKASQKTESVMKKGQPSTVPQSTFNKRSPKPTKVGTKIFENAKAGASVETMFTSQANKKENNSTRKRDRTSVNNRKKKNSAGSSSDGSGNETESSIDSEEEEEDSIEELVGDDEGDQVDQKSGHRYQQSLRRSSRSKQQVSYDDHMSDDELGKPSKKAKSGEEEEDDDDENIDHDDGVTPTTPVAGDCVVPDPDFNDFDSERTMDKFKAGQIWALYSDEDTLPKYYGLITKISAPPNSGLHMTWLSSMKSDDIIPWVNEEMLVTCGRFKVTRKTSQKYEDPGPFSHEVKAQPSKDKNVYDIVPEKGDVWALYKGWNKNMSPEDLQVCEYEVVEVLETDYKSSITVLILEHVKGYKSVFKPQKNKESVELTMQIPWSEMHRFSHHILAVRLSEEKEGTLRGFWELDTAALPVYHFL